MQSNHIKKAKVCTECSCARSYRTSHGHVSRACTDSGASECGNTHAPSSDTAGVVLGRATQSVSKDEIQFGRWAGFWIVESQPRICLLMQLMNRST